MRRVSLPPICYYGYMWFYFISRGVEPLPPRRPSPGMQEVRGSSKIYQATEHLMMLICVVLISSLLFHWIVWRNQWSLVHVVLLLCCHLISSIILYRLYPPHTPTKSITVPPIPIHPLLHFPVCLPASPCTQRGK